MAKTDNDFITRGALYKIIQNIVRTEDIPLTYSNMAFLQHLVDKVMEMLPRWPDGRTMTQTIRLDSDLILKEAIIDSMMRDRTTDERIRIIDKITDDINNYQKAGK